MSFANDGHFDDQMDKDEDEKQMNDDDRSMSSEDDEEDEDQEEMQLMLDIKAQREKLIDNPFNYDANVELIKIYRKCGELEELRAAREQMAQRFPLSTALWLEWINDEKSFGMTKEDKDHVADLFERAIKDYISVEIWLEYVQFAICWLNEENGLKRIRELYERALSFVGLHVQKGSLIWDAFLEFENTIGEISNDESTEKYDRVYQIFKRQLSIPLMFMEDKFAEFKTWLESNKMNKDTNDNDFESVKVCYNKALTELQKLKPYEDALLNNSSSSTLADYLKYIEYEEANGNPARVQCIYERALLDNCLDQGLWLKYINYLDNKIKIFSVSEPVYQRAVRNCPWSSYIWISYLKSIERSDASTKENIKSVFEQAISSGFQSGEEYRQLWLTYLDSLRRHTEWSNEKEIDVLRKSFETAAAHLVNYEDGNAKSIYEYLAVIEAKFCKNIENARKIWNDIILSQREFSSNAENWILYANIERLYGDELSYKKVLLKALNYVNDYIESIGELLIKYEREEGKSIHDLDECYRKYETAKEKVTIRRKAIEKKEKQTKEEKRSRKDQKPKRKLDHNEAAGDFKMPLPTSEFVNEVKKKKLNHDHKEEVKSNENQNKPSFVAHKKPENELKTLQTAFLSNLSYQIAEDELNEVFSKFGKVSEIRLVRNYKNAPKGFAYVEFETIEALKEALKHDRMEIKGRPVFITEMGKKKEFNFTMGEEKNKLFIKNLSLTSDVFTLQDTLRSLFEKYGKVKDVRVVTLRNGHPKGTAYVEFDDELSANKALEADNTLIIDKPINVFISNPPVKGDKSKGNSAVLGAAVSQMHSNQHGKQRISVPLIPTAVRRKMNLN